MGSFNVTCFASQQTISEGNLCWVFPIKRQQTFNRVEFVDEKIPPAYGPFNSTCYADSMWEMTGPMLEARYSDYGRVELIDNPENRKRLSMQVSEWARPGQILPIKQGENKSHDLPLDVAALLAGKERSWELDQEVFDAVWGVAQEARTFTRNYQGEPVPLQFAIMHDEAFKVLLARWDGAKDYRGNSQEPRAWLRANTVDSQEWADMRKKIEELVAGLPEEAAFRKKEVWLFRAESRMRDMLNRISGSGEMNVSMVIQLDEHLAGVFDEKLDFDKFFDDAWPYIKMAWVVGSINALNLRFQPVVYAGQDYSNSIGSEYSKFIQVVSAKVTAGQKRDDEDDEE